MAGNNVIGGVGAVTVVGLGRLMARGAVRIRIGGKKRETVEGVDEVHGYNEKHVSWRLAIDASKVEGWDPVAIKAIESETILIELAGGVTVKMYGAWNSDDVELDAVEGQASLVFESREGSYEP